MGVAGPGRPRVGRRRMGPAHRAPGGGARAVGVRRPARPHRPRVRLGTGAASPGPPGPARLAAGRVDRPVRRCRRVAGGDRVAAPVQRPGAGRGRHAVRRRRGGGRELRPGRAGACGRSRLPDLGLLPAGGEGGGARLRGGPAPAGRGRVPGGDRQAAARDRVPVPGRLRRRACGLPRHRGVGPRRSQPRRHGGLHAGRRQRRRLPPARRAGCCCTPPTRPATSASR